MAGQLVFSGNSCWVDVEAGETTSGSESGTGNPTGVDSHQSDCKKFVGSWL